jgi:hypothetical protein
MAGCATLSRPTLLKERNAAMWSEVLPIVVATVTGGFVLLGYSRQKALEHSRAISEKRRETYSMFIRSTFAAIESRKSTSGFDGSEEIFWKAQISLYGSDEVIRKLGDLTALLPLNSDFHLSSAAPQNQVEIAFDELILAMRKDITPNSRTTLLDLRRSSPLLTER